MFFGDLFLINIIPFDMIVDLLKAHNTRLNISIWDIYGRHGFELFRIWQEDGHQRYKSKPGIVERKPHPPWDHWTAPILIEISIVRNDYAYKEQRHDAINYGVHPAEDRHVLCFPNIGKYNKPLDDDQHK